MEFPSESGKKRTAGTGDRHTKSEGSFLSELSRISDRARNTRSYRTKAYVIGVPICIVTPESYSFRIKKVLHFADKRMNEALTLRHQF